MKATNETKTGNNKIGIIATRASTTQRTILGWDLGDDLGRVTQPDLAHWGIAKASKHAH